MMPNSNDASSNSQSAEFPEDVDDVLDDDYGPDNSDEDDE